MNDWNSYTFRLQLSGGKEVKLREHGRTQDEAAQRMERENPQFKIVEGWLSTAREMGKV